MTITILYSSGGGNTTLVVKKITEILTEAKMTVQCINAIIATPEDLHKTHITILAAPTYDHGIIHEPFERLLAHAHEVDLQGNMYAIIGLGDSKYDQEYTCESALILAKFVEEHGGIVCVDHLLINKNPVDKLDTLVFDRTQHLLNNIQKHADI